jgi:hypothetical protein
MPDFWEWRAVGSLLQMFPQSRAMQIWGVCSKDSQTEALEQGKDNHSLSHWQLNAGHGASALTFFFFFGGTGV